MAKRSPAAAWTRLLTRQARAMSKIAQREGQRAIKRAVKQTMQHAVKPALARAQVPRGPGDWVAGVAMGPGGARRYHLFKPPGATAAEGLPLVVMLHGCGQDGRRFAASTRMNAIAARARFLVLYPEQDLLANAQGCWNWFDTRSGRAQAEAALVLAAVDQVALLYGADRTRVAACGLSAGAGMASSPALVKLIWLSLGIWGYAGVTEMGGNGVFSSSAVYRVDVFFSIKSMHKDVCACRCRSGLSDF